MVLGKDHFSILQCIHIVHREFPFSIDQYEVFLHVVVLHEEVVLLQFSSNSIRPPSLRVPNNGIELVLPHTQSVQVDPLEGRLALKEMTMESHNGEEKLP